MGRLNQHYMDRDERMKLEALHRAGHSVTEIARQLGFCRQTIYNELARGQCEQIRIRNGYYCDVLEYSADKAQQIHQYNQTAKGRPLKIGNDREYAEFLEARMMGIQKTGEIDRRKRYSPAAALELARREGFQTSVCVSTLYSYIDKRVFLHLTNRDLWEKGRKKKQEQDQVQRIAHPALPSILDRPEAAEERQEPGHWEMDLVVSKKGGSHVLMTLTDRFSRRELIFKLPDKRAASVRAVFDKLERNLPDFRQRFRSITTDNGPEFLEYEKLVTSIHGGKRFEVYYCHSYAAWEKGTNENHNRMIRRWYPKGTDFRRVSMRQVADLEKWMNNYPRKSLGWKTPLEAAV